MKKMLFLTAAAVMICSCSIYRKYERPENLPTDSLYRFEVTSSGDNDSSSLGYMPWEEMFTDARLQELIKTGLEHNVNLQTAILRVGQAQAMLTASRLAYAPSVNLAPQGGVSSIDGNKAGWTYNVNGTVGWDIDLFGSLLNAKREAQANLLQQQAYQQAVRSQIIATVAGSYYTLMMLDEQLRISNESVDLWREQVRTMENLLKVGRTNESAVTQARANLYGLEATNADLSRSLRETENAICTLLGMPYFEIERGTLEEQTLPEDFSTGVPLELLSNRPDVLQAEMALAGAYYSTNQARSAFYPSLRLTGTAGWTNSVGQAIVNPGVWILNALGQLTQPVFNNGKLQANLKVSKAEEEIARLNYRQALLNAGEEVNNALHSIETNRYMLEKHRLQCSDLERTYKTTEYLFRNSTGTSYLELLTAQQSLLSARLNAVNDQFQLLQSVVSLYQALGGGKE